MRSVDSDLCIRRFFPLIFGGENSSDKKQVTVAVLFFLAIPFCPFLLNNFSVSFIKYQCVIFTILSGIINVYKYHVTKFD